MLLGICRILVPKAAAVTWIREWINNRAYSPIQSKAPVSSGGLIIFCKQWSCPGASKTLLREDPAERRLCYLLLPLHRSMGLNLSPISQGPRQPLQLAGISHEGTALLLLGRMPKIIWGMCCRCLTPGFLQLHVSCAAELPSGRKTLFDAARSATLALSFIRKKVCMGLIAALLSKMRGDKLRPKC